MICTLLECSMNHLPESDLEQLYQEDVVTLCLGARRDGNGYLIFVPAEDADLGGQPAALAALCRYAAARKAERIWLCPNGERIEGLPYFGEGG